MKPNRKKILVSVPEPLLKKLDAAAKKQGRDRSSEVCLRLDASLKREPAVPVVVTP